MIIYRNLPTFSVLGPCHPLPKNCQTVSFEAAVRRARDEKLDLWLARLPKWLPGGPPTDEELHAYDPAAAAPTADAARELDIDPAASLQ